MLELAHVSQHDSGHSFYLQPVLHGMSQHHRNEDFRLSVYRRLISLHEPSPELAILLLISTAVVC